jgi:hypothetical protein
VIFNEPGAGVTPADSLLNISMPFGGDDYIDYEMICDVWSCFVDFYLLILRRESVPAQAEHSFMSGGSASGHRLTIGLPPRLSAICLDSPFEHCGVHIV